MKASKISDELIEEVKSRLGQPIPMHQLKEKKVAKKVEKKGKKESKKVEKKSNGTGEDQVTLAALADEAEISPATARRKVRALELTRDGRWAWDKGSKQLRTVREALGLK